MIANRARRRFSLRRDSGFPGRKFVKRINYSRHLAVVPSLQIRPLRVIYRDTIYLELIEDMYSVPPRPILGINLSDGCEQPRRTARLMYFRNLVEFSAGKQNEQAALYMVWTDGTCRGQDRVQWLTNPPPCLVTE
jgi:hypothetical protein